MSDLEIGLGRVFANILRNKSRRYPDPTPITVDNRKGFEGERCNVTACSTGLPAIHKHHYHFKDSPATGLAWYCSICARRIAEACRNDDFQLFDFMPPEPDKQRRSTDT